MKALAANANGWGAAAGASQAPASVRVRMKPAWVERPMSPMMSMANNL
jgi:hypothetical protein